MIIGPPMIIGPQLHCATYLVTRRLGLVENLARAQRTGVFPEPFARTHNSEAEAEARARSSKSKSKSRKEQKHEEDEADAATSAASGHLGVEEECSFLEVNGSEAGKLVRPVAHG